MASTHGGSSRLWWRCLSSGLRTAGTRRFKANRSNLEFHRLKVAERVGRRCAHARDRPRVDAQGLPALDVPDALDDGAVLVTVAYQVVVSGQCDALGIMRIVDQEYPPLHQRQGTVLPIVMKAVAGFLCPSGKVEEVARVVAVNQMDRQFQTDDRMQGRRRDQIAAMQHCLGAELFRFGNGGSERFAVIVTVGDDADFQGPPPVAL